ncbi:DUF2254 domain-containing protein [Oceaniglobus roseus]|uniref:DUF2254 domain-containing protein n=1 Tax=Oceaniglobus roseus TaxID=1737570 RepID=UPI000C7EB8C5|nr:DUF2254 domain-containing protein [Kandeliimicrobium roseum]
MPQARAALSKTLYRLRRFSRKIWVRSSLIALLGVVAAGGSGSLAPLVPEDIAKAVEPEAVEKILEIMSSGMLAVVIFSLSVMVSARQSASSQVTPRSHQLLLEDTTTQNVLATFLGAFLFSLVGVITLGTQLYAGDAAAVILAFALLVILLMIVAILRWISHLSDLGSVLATTRRVERAAIDAMEAWLNSPCMGGRKLTGPPEGDPVKARRSGYVQHIDMEKLSDAMEDCGGKLFLAARPGAFVTEGQPIAHCTAKADMDQVHLAFTIDDIRRFDQDPRFGVIVLSEIAQRALSPGINDPGTAIDVLTRQERLLSRYRDRIEHADDDALHPRIHVPPLTADALVRDAFDPIARDGAAMVEVQIRVQKALAHLAETGDPDMKVAARDAAARALQRAVIATALPADRQRLLRTVARCGLVDADKVDLAFE